MATRWLTGSRRHTASRRQTSFRQTVCWRLTAAPDLESGRRAPRVKAQNRGTSRTTDSDSGYAVPTVAFSFRPVYESALHTALNRYGSGAADQLQWIVAVNLGYGDNGDRNGDERHCEKCSNEENRYHGD